MTKASKEDVALDCISCIHYPIQFQKDGIKALIDLGIKVNAITLTYIGKLGLKVCRTNVGVWKINGYTLKIFGIILASF